MCVVVNASEMAGTINKMALRDKSSLVTGRVYAALKINITIH